jgi:hypothetical protein
MLALGEELSFVIVYTKICSLLRFPTTLYESIIYEMYYSYRKVEYIKDQDNNNKKTLI